MQGSCVFLVEKKYQTYSRLSPDSFFKISQISYSDFCLITKYIINFTCIKKNEKKCESRYKTIQT